MPKYRPYLYFAYGSNLNRRQFAHRCPGAQAIRPLFINDWRLVFRGVADVQPHDGSTLPGALYRITAKCEEVLDRYEGLKSGLYRKTDFVLQDGQPVMMYQMNRGALEVPSGFYFDAIYQGYRDWELPLPTLEAALAHARANAQQSRRVASPERVAKDAKRYRWLTGSAR